LRSNDAQTAIAQYDPDHDTESEVPSVSRYGASYKTIGMSKFIS
jgi:hypothetical protein